MSSQGVERREFQRLHLDSPIAGKFGSTDVSVVEVGILGAQEKAQVAADVLRPTLKGRPALVAALSRVGTVDGRVIRGWR